LSFLSKKEIPLIEIIPDGYVDIHSHLIPGIDDGVKTIYQSAYILEQFGKLGIKKAITTPHVMQDVWPNSTQIISDGLEDLQTILKPLKVSIHIEASAEYMMDDLFFQRIKTNDILPLYNDYILVEMSTFSPPINLTEILFEIKLAGYTPILAHPERYAFYHQNDLKKYSELKKQGFLFQLNLLSLSGYYGDKVKDIAKKLMEQNYIDFTGSDIHNYHQLGILEVGFIPKVAEKLSKLLPKNKVFA